MDVWLLLKIATGLDPPKTDLATRNMENSDERKEDTTDVTNKCKINSLNLECMSKKGKPNQSQCRHVTLNGLCLMFNVKCVILW